MPAFLLSGREGEVIGEINLPRNEEIKVNKVRVVDENGKQIGIMPTWKALDIARKRNLDLVLVAPNENPPVAKIMDYGKYKYQMAKRQKEARKRQKQMQVKQMKFRIKIDDHDYQTKLKHIRRFLENGDKVRVVIMFIGREIVFSEKGKEILQRVIEDTKDLAVVETQPKLEGRDMWMVLKPKSV